MSPPFNSDWPWVIGLLLASLLVAIMIILVLMR